MPKTFDKLVEEVIDTRLSEINKLRLHLSTINDQDVKWYLASLITARLYAFLESGVKEMVNSYILSHGTCVADITQLRNSYIAWRYARQIKAVVANCPADTELLKLDMIVKGDLSTKPISTINIRYEYSTMNSKAILEIYAGCGFDSAVVAAHAAEIDQLCSRRQDVAHGRFINVTSIQELVTRTDSFKRLVTELLYDLAYQCIDGRTRQALKS